MRVILQVTAGASAGRKTLLGANQVVQVGRTEWADFAVAHDGHMSGLHFALETDNASCYIKDLGSTNGTFVNGQPLAERRVLKGGDEIRAGETLFTVRVEGEEAREVPEPAESAPSADRPTAPLADRLEAPLVDRPVVSRPELPGRTEAPSARRRRGAAYTVERCESGLTLCRGELAEVHPTDLGLLLGQNLPLYLIVDLRKLGAPLPEDVAHPDVLFDWLNPEAAAIVSPVVVAQQETASWPALLEAGWGQDAVVCLFCKQEKPGLLEHLRRYLRAKRKRDDLGGGMVGLCWPSVLAMLLAYGAPAYVREVLTGIEAVLVELPDLPETWQLYGDAQVTELLDRLGFVRKSAENVN